MVIGAALKISSPIVTCGSLAHSNPLPTAAPDRLSTKPTRFAQALSAPLWESWEKCLIQPVHLPLFLFS
jgi:hypothetical protein